MNKPKYIVVCEDDVFYSSDKLLDCYFYITNAYKKFPKHADLNIYEFRK